MFGCVDIVLTRRNQLRRNRANSEDPAVRILTPKPFTCSAELRWQANAIMCLQEAAEAYLVSILCWVE